jgi:hypothetical protein
MFLQITRAISIEFGPYKIPKDLTPGAIREIHLTPELEQLYLKTIAAKKTSRKDASKNRNRDHPRAENTESRTKIDRLSGQEN